jgi:hypothetical protein
VQDGIGYILFTRGSDNNYYVLKADGTTERFDNADGFDELTNEYKWTVTHVYTEDEIERFNIHSYTDPSHSLALNSPGKSLLASGANNIIVNPSGDGYTFTGYNETKLGLTQDGGSKKFAGVTSEPAVMYFYEQAPLTSYKFTVTSNDIKRGKLVGRDNVGVMQGETQDCAEYTAGTTADKKNQYTIKAVPQSNKYIFDHWELNGVKISAGSTINPEDLDIPYNGSSLEAIFKVNPDYNASDDEKEGQGFDDASKAEHEYFSKWYADLYRPILDKAAIMNGNTLVLFDKIDIGKNLFEKFKEIYPNKSVFYSDGQTKVQDREKIREDFEKSDGNILFSNV